MITQIAIYLFLKILIASNIFTYCMDNNNLIPYYINK